MKKVLILSLVLLLSLYIVNAQENNESSNLSDVTNETVLIEPTNVSITNFTLLKIIPNEMNIGDTQLNLQIENTGNTDVSDVSALITGKGVSTYNIEPIDILHPGERGYILLWISTKQAGNISLNIKIKDKIFTKEITVINPNAQSGEGIDLEKLNLLNNELTNLTKLYDQYNADYKKKKDVGYDVSGISFTDVKNYIRNAQVYSTKKDVINLEANTVLIQSELEDIKSNLDSVVIPQKSIKDDIKNNLPLISGVLGTLVTFFAVWEILKKKKESLNKSIKKLDKQKKKFLK
ncbi:MAG: hypothetical protein NT139_00080 [Candidatus Woesearchaeota archaeon]|nr:hypothetical protein [Candidatus Woesearchaeota archaeon]